MKSKLIAVALFSFTAATVVLYPAYQSIGAAGKPSGNPVTVDLPRADPLANEKPKVEVVFALDTTGSMSGLIQAAKEKIWSIATTMAQAETAPEIRMGLVGYRDRGDVYVTKVVDLSDDLDTLYATLMDFRANGGGDGPESVNQALYDAVHNMSWSQDHAAYKAVFLVGDAPPHMDYQDEVQYSQSLAVAKQKGIVVNAVQCGQQALIEGKTKQRVELQQEINELSEKRATYLKKKVGEAGGAEDSLDAKIYRAVREQAGEKGLVYEADAPSY